MKKLSLGLISFLLCSSTIFAVRPGDRGAGVGATMDSDDDAGAGAGAARAPDAAQMQQLIAQYIHPPIHQELSSTTFDRAKVKGLIRFLSQHPLVRADSWQALARGQNAALISRMQGDAVRTNDHLKDGMSFFCSKSIRKMFHSVPFASFAVLNLLVSYYGLKDLFRNAQAFVNDKAHVQVLFFGVTGALLAASAWKKAHGGLLSWLLFYRIKQLQAAYEQGVVGPLTEAGTQQSAVSDDSVLP